jgi:signal transduction histidine kinase
MPRRGTVGVKIRSEGAAVVLEVSNGGSPIPQPRMSRLFKPFQPGHALATPAGAEPARITRRGLGLGLFIADQIVRAHAGSIDVASSIENGTVFSVRRPRALSAEAAVGLGKPAAAAPTRPREPV